MTNSSPTGKPSNAVFTTTIVCVVLSVCRFSHAADQPNILLVLSADHGVPHPGACGCEESWIAG
ncbi:MAG TPA: hypothetical protein EYG03_28960 [Planctomycetes bacterium]|nr:hypothetical protein [Fuerstiella sp.]HIK95994.1 hypothetical protein [Planctomycetota bacterium]